MSDPDTLWLTRYAPRAAARVRLVCFPHGGGSALFYRRWARVLPRWLELIAVQYPGRMERAGEPHIDQMEPMVEALAGVIARRVHPPVALFGHSMGAAIAFETALRLEREYGRTPLALFVSGRKGPSRHRPGQRHLAPEEAMFAHLRRLGGTQSALFEQPALRPFVLPTLRSDFKLSETWRPVPGAQVGCPLVAFIGDQDPEAPVEAVSAWDRATRAEFRLRVFSGEHFYLLGHEQELIEDVVRTLALLSLTAQPLHATKP